MVDRKQLQALVKEISTVAKDCGLDFFETRFEVVDFETMNELASYGGFPVRYPHWRFGMEYARLKKSYTYGLHKIYEMVINNDPSYAYLLEDNSVTDHKLVMAHVFAHVDFFKNNQWFAPTNRKMMDEMANHGARIRRYIEQYGHDEVERFLDLCLGLENLVDYHAPYVVRSRPGALDEEDGPVPEDGDAFRFKSKKYMDPFINPAEAVAEAERTALETARQASRRFPVDPERDILGFIAIHAPLEKWQRNVLSMVREEAYYFAPQGMTKILNEGWATYWHSRMMTGQLLEDSEVVEYADHHSATVATSAGQLNPYALGLALLRDVEERWDKGRFGKEYEDCDDIRERENWDLELGLGRKKLFEIRRVYNDVMFIDEFLTPEFVSRNRMFRFREDDNGTFLIDSREFSKVKGELLSALTNLGEPRIEIRDANYDNRGELYLGHLFEGSELRRDWAAECLQGLASLWSRPVHLETWFDDENILLSTDGEKFEKKVLESED